MDILLKSYKKDFSYSYVFGTFAVIELIDAMPENVLQIIISEGFDNLEILERITNSSRALNFQVIKSDRLIAKISPKENVYIVGVFKKYVQEISENTPHVVLVNPSNFGNLGTIIRGMLGFSILNLAIIGTSADIFDPKTIRASMGAIFKINHEHFSDIEQYLAKFKDFEHYSFMLDTENKLQNVMPTNRKFSLIFGNEATGLDDSYYSLSTPVRIPHSSDIDSLNLSIAACIAMYEFTKKDFN